MATLLLSNVDMFLANFLWVWGGPLPAVLLCSAALFAHIGDERQNSEL